MPYARFVQAVRTALKARGDTQKDDLRTAAFIGWQLAGAFGGKQTNFKSYLKRLGLYGDDVQRIDPEQRQREIAEARSNSRKALEAFRVGVTRQ